MAEGGGRQPQIGLEPRICPACGASYQPYRANSRACSWDCYRSLPDVKFREARRKATPRSRARKNAARRIDANPGQREINLRQGLRHLYGITLEQYREKLAVQDGKCAICGKPPTEGGIKAAFRLHVDHDHVTRVNRGLLCGSCNRGVGYFHDDPLLLQSAIDYLRRYL